MRPPRGRPVERGSSKEARGSSKEAPQAGPAGHTVPASCGQEPQKARPRLAGGALVSPARDLHLSESRAALFSGDDPR